MAYIDRPGNTISEPGVGTPVVEYHDRVRWGPIFAGIVVALATQLVLSALGAAIGLGGVRPGADAGNVGTGIGIWAIISLLISLFIGSWIMASTCGPMNSKTALLNGTILWGTTLALSSWLLASGVAGAFGVLANNAPELINQAQQQGVTPDQAQINQQQAAQIAQSTSRAAWSFIFGSLLGLVAALMGASFGARRPRMRA